MRLGKTRLVRDIVVAIMCVRITREEYTLVVSDYMYASDITLGDASDTTESTFKRLIDGDMEITMSKKQNRVLLKIRILSDGSPPMAVSAGDSSE